MTTHHPAAQPLTAAIDQLLGPGGAEPHSRDGVRLGVDLVHVPRIAQLMERHGERWLADHFTERERDQLAVVRGTPTATVAGRIAAKESFIKVLAPAGQLVLTRDVEVLRGPGGAPLVHPRGSALRQLRAHGIDRWTVSITHEGEWALAVAAGCHPPPFPASPPAARSASEPGVLMERIAAWIQAKNPGLDRPVTPQEDLIEGRLIDSLDFLEFIYLLEDVSGRTIDLQEVSVDDFRTLERIRERFLGHLAPATS